MGSVRKRKQTTVDFSTNNKTAESLSRGMVYRELYLNLTATPTVTIANNTAAKAGRGDEWSVIKRIDVIANNTDVIKSISGTALWWLNYFLYGRIPNTSSALGDGATANPVCDSALILPFWMPRSVKPMDTALDARTLSDLKIEVTWGTFTDVSDDASAWTTEPSLDIYSLEVFGVSGPFSQWRMYPIENTVTASNPNFQIQLPVGPMYRGFLINTVSDGIDVGTILGNVKVKAGTTIFHDLPERIVELSQVLRTGLESGVARESSDASLDGWYYVDLVTDGYNTEAIDTLGFSEFELELDVTKVGTTDTVHVWPQQIIPIRSQ